MAKSKKKTAIKKPAPTAKILPAPPAPTSKFVAILSDGTYLADDDSYDAPMLFESLDDAVKALEDKVNNEFGFYDDDGNEVLEVVKRYSVHKEDQVKLYTMPSSL